MPRTFIGKMSGIAALLGLVFVVVLAAFGYFFVSAFHADDEALSTYAEELMTAQSLGEAVQRKIASGRGYLLDHQGESRRAFEQADADISDRLNTLRARVKSAEGIRLLAVMAGGIEAHDRALRSTMAAAGTVDELAHAWAADVRPLVVALRREIDAFIRHKQTLYERAKAAAYHAQRRALFVTYSIALIALAASGFGGVFLLRSARSTFAVETQARAAAEKERAFFTALLEHLPIGVIAAEAPSGRIVLTTRWARQLLAAARPDAPLPDALSDFAAWRISHLDGSPFPVENTPLARALRGEVIQTEELRLEDRRAYAVTAGPIRDQSGAIVAAVAGFADVTDKKEAEKARELFIAALGHDLRNPLMAISMAADTLTRRGDLPATAPKHVGRIASSARRMERLIGELLDFARSQHGALPLNPEHCRLSDVAAEIVDELKAAHPDRDIRLHRGDDCRGHWDRGRMSQVFQNLIGNAIQHGGPGRPVEITVGCTPDRAWAKVTNSDGVIPPEEQAHIFEPFRAGKHSRGLGLGLYIARAIVEAHGGLIGVVSKNGETTFAIELPIAARTGGALPAKGPRH
jgi:signal transduction histidine kinase